MKRNQKISKPVLATFGVALASLVTMAIQCPEWNCFEPAFQSMGSNARLPAAVDPSATTPPTAPANSPVAPKATETQPARLGGEEVKGCSTLVGGDRFNKLVSMGKAEVYCRNNCHGDSDRPAVCEPIIAQLDKEKDCKDHKDNAESTVKTLNAKCEKVGFESGDAESNAECFKSARTCLDDLDDIDLEDRTPNLADCKQIQAIAGKCFDFPIVIEKTEEEKEKEKEKAKTSNNGERPGINISIDNNKEAEKSAAEKLAEADKELAKALREIQDKQRQAFVDYRKADLDVDKQYVEIRDKQRLAEITVANAKDSQVEMCIKYANERFQTEEAKINRLEAEIKAAKQAQRFNVAANMLAGENRLRQRKIAARRVTVWNTFYFECMEGRGPGSRFINLIRQAERMLLNENAKAEDLSKVLEKERNNAYQNLNEMVMMNIQDRQDIITTTNQTKQAIQAGEMERKQKDLRKQMEDMYKKAMDANTPDSKKACPVAFLNNFKKRKDELNSILSATNKTRATCQLAKVCTIDTFKDCNKYAAIGQDKKKKAQSLAFESYLAPGKSKAAQAFTTRSTVQKGYIPKSVLSESQSQPMNRQLRQQDPNLNNSIGR